MLQALLCTRCWDRPQCASVLQFAPAHARNLVPPLRGHNKRLNEWPERKPHTLRGPPHETDFVVGEYPVSALFDCGRLDADAGRGINDPAIDAPVEELPDDGEGAVGRRRGPPTMPSSNRTMSLRPISPTFRFPQARTIRLRSVRSASSTVFGRLLALTCRSRNSSTTASTVSATALRAATFSAPGSRPSLSARIAARARLRASTRSVAGNEPSVSLRGFPSWR